MIEFVRIPVGEGGAVACRCCAAPVPETYATLDALADSIASAGDARSADTDLNVILDGAEPFKHPALPAVIGLCVAAGARRLAARTDAGALAISENAQGSLAAGLRQIHVPLFGPDAATHDALCSSAGFEKSCAGMEHFMRCAKQAGIDALIIGILPLCEHNISQAAGTIATFARLGATAVRIGASTSLADSPQVKAACETGMANGLWVWHEQPGTPGGRSLAAHTRAPFTIVAVTT